MKNSNIKMVKFILIFSILYMVIGHTNYMSKVFNANQTSAAFNTFEFKN